MSYGSLTGREEEFEDAFLTKGELYMAYGDTTRLYMYLGLREPRLDVYGDIRTYEYVFYYNKQLWVTSRDWIDARLQKLTGTS